MTDHLLQSILVFIFLLNLPIFPAGTSNPADALSPISFANSPGILFIHSTGDSKCKHEHPYIATLHSFPPAPLDAHLPETVNAHTSTIQEHTAAMLAFNKAPQACEEATKEESLCWKEAPRQPSLEEADAGPRSRYGAGNECCETESPCE